MIDELVKQVQNREPRAALLAAQIGPAANPRLLALLADPTPKVRRVALYCLKETGGADAVRAFVASLADVDAQVRAAAMDGLDARHAEADPGLATALLDAYDHAADAALKQPLALLLGRLADTDRPRLRALLDAETAPLPREALLAACARLGASDAQRDFAELLKGARGDALERWLPLAQYVGAAWLLPALLPALDDETPVVQIGVDGRPDLPTFLTARDVAAKLVAAITGHTFSFAPGPPPNLGAAEAAEVRAFVEKTSP
jgi:HEAT repeat protein